MIYDHASVSQMRAAQGSAETDYRLARGDKSEHLLQKGSDKPDIGTDTT